MLSKKQKDDIDREEENSKKGCMVTVALTAAAVAALTINSGKKVEKKQLPVTASVEMSAEEQTAYDSEDVDGCLRLARLHRQYADSQTKDAMNFDDPIWLRARNDSLKSARFYDRAYDAAVAANNPEQAAAIAAEISTFKSDIVFSYSGEGQKLEIGNAHSTLIEVLQEQGREFVDNKEMYVPRVVKVRTIQTDPAEGVVKQVTKDLTLSPDDYTVADLLE